MNSRTAKLMSEITKDTLNVIERMQNEKEKKKAKFLWNSSFTPFLLMGMGMGAVTQHAVMSAEDIEKIRKKVYEDHLKEKMKLTDE